MAGSYEKMLKRTTRSEVIAEGKRRGRRLIAELALKDIRLLEGVSQRDLAKILGIKQPSLSKLENQKDMQIATLRRIIEALGGELELVAKLPNRTVRLRPFTDRKKRKRAA